MRALFGAKQVHVELSRTCKLTKKSLYTSQSLPLGVNKKSLWIFDAAAAATATTAAAAQCENANLVFPLRFSFCLSFQPLFQLKNTVRN